MPTSSFVLRTYVREHEHLPAFHAAYVVFVFMAAILLNAGFFALCVLAHVTLNVVKYREVRGLSWPKTVRAVVRDNVIDAVLLLFALCLTIYMHHDGGIAGVGGMLRAQATVIRGLAMTLPEMQVFGRTLTVFSHLRVHLKTLPKGVGKPLGSWERLLMGIVLGELLVLAVAPMLLGFDGAGFLELLAGQLLPWRV